MGVDLDGNAGYSFTIWDNGGINVYSPLDVDSYAVNEGDSILLRGTVAQFNGLTQFEPDSIALINSSNPIPAPTVVTSLDESTESELLRFENFWVESISGINYTLNAAGGLLMISQTMGCESSAVIDEVTYVALDADESYGRVNDGSDLWVVFTIATPNAMNELLGVEELGNSALRAWPNPNAGKVLNFSKVISYKLYNITGQLVAVESNVVSTYLSNLDSGIYLLETEQGETLKVVIK